MLYEQGVSSPVSHIKLQNVLRRAGLTTGAAYRLWDGQPDFQHELAATATRRNDERMAASLVNAVAELIERGAPLAEIIRVATNQHVSEIFGSEDSDPLADTMVLINIAMRATAHSTDTLRDASRSWHLESLGAYVDLYVTLQALGGLRMREPYTMEQFALVMAALAEGFTLQAIQGSPHPTVEVPDARGVPQEWTLFGRAVLALVEGLMEPGDADSGEAEPGDADSGDANSGDADSGAAVG